MISSFKVTRLTEDSAGNSHFEAFSIERRLQDYAPPAHPFLVSPVEAASGFVVIRLPVGWIGETHPTPRRQLLFCLSGSAKVTAGNGDDRVIKAGDGLLMEDTGGKGHTTEVVSDVPFDAVVVLLTSPE